MEESKEKPQKRNVVFGTLSGVVLGSLAGVGMFAWESFQGDVMNYHHKVEDVFKPKQAAFLGMVAGGIYGCYAAINHNRKVEKMNWSEKEKVREERASDDVARSV